MHFLSAIFLLYLARVIGSVREGVPQILQVTFKRDFKTAKQGSGSRECCNFHSYKRRIRKVLDIYQEKGRNPDTIVRVEIQLMFTTFVFDSSRGSICDNCFIGAKNSCSILKTISSPAIKDFRFTSKDLSEREYYFVENDKPKSGRILASVTSGSQTYLLFKSLKEFKVDDDDPVQKLKSVWDPFCREAKKASEEEDDENDKFDLSEVDLCFENFPRKISDIDTMVFSEYCAQLLFNDFNEDEKEVLVMTNKIRPIYELNSDDIQVVNIPLNKIYIANAVNREASEEESEEDTDAEHSVECSAELDTEEDLTSSSESERNSQKYEKRSRNAGNEEERKRKLRFRRILDRESGGNNASRISGKGNGGSAKKNSEEQSNKISTDKDASNGDKSSLGNGGGGNGGSSIGGGGGSSSGFSSTGDRNSQRTPENTNMTEEDTPNTVASRKKGFDKKRLYFILALSLTVPILVCVILYYYKV